MNELDTLSKIYFLKEKINNKIDKKEVLKEINNIHKEIMSLPIEQEFRDLIVMYQKEYGEYLFCDICKGDGQ